MKHDFYEFLTEQEAPPVRLDVAVQKDVLLSFRARSILGKFLFFQILGGLFSLSVCPQFGIGLVEGHGITHVFRMIGDWACAAFCGSLFLSAGAILAFIGMKGEELWWVWRRYKYSLMILPGLFWGGLMLANISFDLGAESVSYHLVWTTTAVLTMMALMQLRSRIYSRALA